MSRQSWISSGASGCRRRIRSHVLDHAYLAFLVEDLVVVGFHSRRSRPPVPLAIGSVVGRVVYETASRPLGVSRSQDRLDVDSHAGSATRRSGTRFHSSTVDSSR
jgi:hypothetical protein